MTGEYTVEEMQFLSTPSARRATTTMPPSFGSMENFYPRPPRGGRPLYLAATGLQLRISIHALREEGDISRDSKIACFWDFYPRPPRGGRHDGISFATINGEFLSTPSARRATWQIPLYLPWQGISIHALREEGDSVVDDVINFNIKFLSTPSARRATTATVKLLDRWEISIHALREEGDSKNRDKISIFKQIIQHSARI